MPRRAAKPILSWDDTAELIGLALFLQPNRSFQATSNFSTQLHAWFLDQVRSMNPDLSAYLHDGQSEKAFTISGLEGSRVGRSIQFEAEQLYAWTVTGLNHEVCEWMQQWLVKPPTEIKLRGEVFRIVRWEIGLPAMTYEAVWEQAGEGRQDDLNLTFLSATSFRKRQNHLPLPMPENVFHSYLRRWNDFASITVEQEDFLNWVNECVVILRHEVRSLKVQAGKQGSVTGFVGRVQFGLSPKAKGEPDYVQMVRSLVVCAPYFGTGHKVTFGLGQTRAGWLEVESVEERVVEVAEWKDSVEVQRRVLIEARRAVLKAFFFGLKKRQGGERAEKAADLWATIVARQEFGESLKGIAEDLGIGYESVKKYSQLARKAMKE
ncbi:CRISPR-associated endoribonuclease Cas6 [Phormidesmis sp. 146-33]